MSGLELIDKEKAGQLLETLKKVERSETYWKDLFKLVNRAALDYNLLMGKFIAKMEENQELGTRGLGFAMFRGTRYETWTRNLEDHGRTQAKAAWDFYAFAANTDMKPSALSVTRILRVSNIIGMWILTELVGPEAITTKEMMQLPCFPSTVPRTLPKESVQALLTVHLILLEEKASNVVPKIEINEQFRTNSVRTVIALYSMNVSSASRKKFWEDLKAPMAPIKVENGQMKCGSHFSQCLLSWKQSKQTLIATYAALLKPHLDSLELAQQS